MLALTAALPGLASADAARPAPAPVAGPVQVVVQSTGDRAAAVRAVEAAGGTVTLDLPIVDGVAASVPSGALDRLAHTPGVLAVTRDEAVRTTSTAAEGPSGATVKQAFLQSTGASRLHARGVVGTHRPGTPTRVALVDTGVDTEAATTGDLAGRVVPVVDPRTPGGRPVACVDLSGESSCDDDYGHGTFMAGLIAGSGAASDGRFSGTAPGAELVSIKIAGRSGASDVTRVLAAVQWAVSFRERYDIGVLNLSLGTRSRTDPRVDPLNRAVQRAWDSGIVVVAAAGNSGRPEAGLPWTITKPADDPLVLTVGATDDRETPATADDRTPRFSSRGGPGLAKPDVVAPGAHVVSLRAVGSAVDGAGTPLDATYRRGSGTSMSAAVVSGAVALLREARPTWTPDQVKHALRTTARQVALDDPYAVGTGMPDVERATSADLTGAAQPRTPAVLGSVDGPGHDWTGHDWTGHDWTGHDWTEAGWYASAWTGHDWTGHDWTGHDWTGHDWTGHDWTGSDWTAADGSPASDDDEEYGPADTVDGSLVPGSLVPGSAS